MVLQITDFYHISFQYKEAFSQSCPFSPYLFIICIEVWTNQIINNESISGMTKCGFELKNARYADDASLI